MLNLKLSLLSMYEEVLEDYLYGSVSIEEIEDIGDNLKGLYLHGLISYDDYHSVNEDIEATLLYA